MDSTEVEVELHTLAISYLGKRDHFCIWSIFPSMSDLYNFNWVLCWEYAEYVY